MIRLLVVDDSALMRRLLTEVFADEADFVVETARSGEEAIAKLHDFAPDVITLDIHMPGMDGLACLDRIMLERPCPVVMISALTAEGAAETLEAIELGAVDFVAKPGGAISLRIEALAPVIIDKVRAASRARLSTVRLRDRVRLRSGRLPVPTGPPRAPGRIRPKPMAAPAGDRIVLVGSSTGGPPALDALLAPLPADFPWPIVVAQHMPATFTDALAQRLDRLCALNVAEVSRATPLLPGHVYIGRGDADVVLSRRAGSTVAMAMPSSAEHRWHPSVDRLVDSAMDHRPAEQLIGVLMTGMGSDGADAMARLRATGGWTIAEAEESAVVWGMPGALVRLGGAAVVAPLDRLAGELMKLAAV